MKILLQKFILNQAKEKKWEYTADEYTDQPPEELIVQSVRARLLDFLPQEIPYQLTSEIEYYNQDRGQTLMRPLYRNTFALL